MKAKDLRIGNWVIEDGMEMTVRSIREDGWYDETEPIPITEEWLIKFGFIGSGHYRLDDIELGTADDDFVKAQFTVRYKSAFISKKIKHVHQLQNLYFALTNNELTWDS